MVALRNYSKQSIINHNLGKVGMILKLVHVQHEISYNIRSNTRANSEKQMEIFLLSIARSHDGPSCVCVTLPIIFTIDKTEAHSVQNNPGYLTPSHLVTLVH